MIYCFDDNKAFVCATGYYLDINNFKCNQICPNGYMRPPAEILFVDREMCNVPCDQTSANCPNTSLTFNNIKENFSCKNNYLAYYYKCISPSDSTVSNSNFN